MNLIAFTWPYIFFFLICGTTLVVYNNQYNIPIYQAHQYINQDLIPVPSKELQRLQEAQIPTLTQEECFLNEYCNCPRYQGTYEQCTNNYKHKPNQDFCTCNNRNFELCPWPFKILEGKYVKKPVRPTADNYKTIQYPPHDELYMNVQEVTKVPEREKGAFAMPPADVRVF